MVETEVIRIDWWRTSSERASPPNEKGTEARLMSNRKRRGTRTGKGLSPMHTLRERLGGLP